LKLSGKGTVDADERARTNIEDIFAGGDIVTGAATVIAAMGAGKHAAREIDKYLQSKR
ncbi:MAG: dihydropyrimidine dehydrogenase, partial [Candidatus Omnitrophota bacterium]